MTDAFDDILARLYTAPPEDFIAARTEAAKLARDAGDRTRAVAIAKLRKPTVGAWLVNLLAHQRPDLVADLLQLGEELRSAQRELRGADLRELSQRRRASISALARQARALAIAAGRGVRDALPLAEVEATLTAALAEPDVAEQVREGRLTKTVEYAGFGETPRPRLRLVQGGLDEDEAPVDDADDAALDDARDTDTGRSRTTKRPDPVQGRPTSVKKPAAREPAVREPTGKSVRREPASESDEDRAAREQIRTEAERKAAERAAAAERRKARAAAHRELLAARTQLAEAEAARTAAERAVLEARRRVEKALARAAELDTDQPDE